MYTTLVYNIGRMQLHRIWPLLQERISLTLLVDGRFSSSHCIFFFQAEDGIRDVAVTGVQTCALPISLFFCAAEIYILSQYCGVKRVSTRRSRFFGETSRAFPLWESQSRNNVGSPPTEIGRASCRERV